MFAKIIQEFRQDIKEICQPVTHVPKRVLGWYTNYRLSARLKKHLAKSPEGQTQLAYLKKHKIKIESDATIPGQGRYQVAMQDFKDGKPVWSEGKIMFNLDAVDAENDSALAAIFYHEIWHIRQYYGGVGSIPADAPVEDYCWWERSIEADAQSFATEICYRLKLSGDDASWLYYRENENLGPMCLAFEAACQKDPKALEQGTARRQAFNAWFKSEFLKDHYDACAVRNYQTNRKRLEQIPDFDLPKRHLTFLDVEKLGTLATVNYLKLPEFKNLAAKKYRGNMGPETKEEIQHLKQMEKNTLLHPKR